MSEDILVEDLVNEENNSVKTWIATKDDLIVFCCDSDSEEKVYQSLENMGITNYDQVITIESLDYPLAGTYLDEYDEGFVLKSDFERVQLGRLQLAEGFELDHENKAIKLKPPDPVEGMDLEATKKWALEILSDMCVSTNYSILNQHKRDNIYCGATEGYPDYLQNENGIQTIKLMNNFFRNFYAENAAIITNLETKEEIKLFIENLSMPTETQILQEVTTNQN